MRVLAYVYPGWHAIPEREPEWDLVERCTSRFDGHAQPRLPLWGRYDDRDPVAIERRIQACRQHGIDGLVYGLFWCRGKRVFEDALDLGLLGGGTHMPFAVMWANRLPRKVLPVRRADVPVIADDRLVTSDVADFVALVATVAERYFTRAEYLRVGGAAYFSIFDSTFFLRELGRDAARTAISAAREMLRSRGLPPLHLAAIDPAADVIGDLAALGFDSVTHYVLLPDWKGPTIQDYAERAAISAARWAEFRHRSQLPYHPAVATGWDASPRGLDFGRVRPAKYPWSPVVVGEHPDRFRDALVRALDTASELVFVASLNEWSEGHYLEPDTRFGMQWFEAVRAARIAGCGP